MGILMNLTKQKLKFEPGLIGFFINPSFFCRRGLIKNIRKFKDLINGCVLDVGCGSKPYQSEFKNAIQYIGLDIEVSGHNHQNEKIDVFYDGINIPFNNESFDSVVSFEVLEHIFHPGILLKEINRVLKPNGFFLLTTPFIWDEHEQPFDYARYTSFGLRHILKENGFEIVKFEKSVQDIRVIFQLANNFFNKKLMKLPKIIYYSLTIIHTTFFNFLGCIVFPLGGKSSDMYLNNIVFAKKIN
jgi:SAM-dependent methyltransferase